MSRFMNSGALGQAHHALSKYPALRGKEHVIDKFLSECDGEVTLEGLFSLIQEVLLSEAQSKHLSQDHADSPLGNISGSKQFRVINTSDLKKLKSYIISLLRTAQLLAEDRNALYGQLFGVISAEKSTEKHSDRPELEKELFHLYSDLSSLSPLSSPQPVEQEQPRPVASSRQSISDHWMRLGAFILFCWIIGFFSGFFLSSTIEVADIYTASVAIY